MDDPPSQHASHFFTLRLWRAEAGNGQAAWRGKLQHVLSGESRYFQNWPALVAGLRALLAEQGPEPHGTDKGDREEDVMN